MLMNERSSVRRLGFGQAAGNCVLFASRCSGFQRFVGKICKK